MNPFDYVNSISYKKNNLMRDTDNDELAEQEYVPYLTNKAFSYYTDTILYANEMNKFSFLDKKMQYEYLLQSIRANRRYTKWTKKEELKDVAAISKYFDVSYKRAEEYKRLLSLEKINEIIDKIENL